ncbi:hypothetical protein PIB30_019133 [Stylosanthes scabra]|uniref:peptidylprolyl isomerase n=1 Tax=Stylosanthes scabra TaxID=79078 RepID=A0ABU6W821_9FABA|nr:hypothetical protein [Stylosanthes scabra]
MGFWGIEVKPGKPYPYHADNIQGKLHVTHATLGIGSSNEKTILQCSSGHKSPIFLCSLMPDKIESCPLNLEFGDDDLVAFSVIGPRSIHLSGYFVADDGDDLRDDYEYDSFPEDVEGTDSEDSSDYDSEDEYGDDSTDDSDMEMYPSSHVPNSGVRIEEIVDDDMPENEEDPTQKLKKKKQAAQMKEKDNKSSRLPIVVRGETGHPVLESEDDVEESEDDVSESEDEDGFPILAAEKGKSEVKGNKAHKTAEEAGKNAGVNHSPSLKRKVESADVDEQQQQDRKKKKKKNKSKEPGKGESAQTSGKSSVINVATPDEKHPEEEEVKTTEVHDRKPSNEDLVEKKKKNKKKNKAKESQGEDATPSQVEKPVENKKLSASEKKGKKQETETKPSQVRTFPNGLVIEEISMGRPDGNRAAPGKKVSVRYIGKLQKNGKIFDSNVGRAPFKFHLGVGQVIKGWDVGVNGMRVGDKRRITVPPSMGYGDRRIGSIPPNSWLVFDVELINVG